MTDRQTLVAQGFTADANGAEQPRGPSVLVVGASGLVGRAVVRRLVAQTWAGSVTALVRRPGALAAGQALPGRLRECVVDFARLDAPETQSVLAADIVICALGTTLRDAGSQAAFRRVDVDYPAEIARRAFAAGAHHFLLVSALGADTRSRLFYNRCKGEAEAAILSVGFPSVTVVRPSLLLGKRAAFRLGERVAQMLSKAVDGLVPKAWRPVPVESVAAVLVTAARVDAPGVRVLENPALLAAQDERPVA
ncbi:oxidoreductase [Ralstonia pseudosolanacearum]|uniref:Oxidoreductase n=1 Tax=Ralstonia solanacearum TaxID=305 RepID=A0AA92EBA7_RALSL|nr:oxidoreductase [Ralstonia pseudosolanacearum]QCX48789.1 oxidoreductase [Ralstonia pseudosolanacearum]